MDKVILHQFAPSFGIPNASPFCMKVETFLRLADIDYQLETIDNPSAAPYGKLPFIKHGREVVPDSTLIIKYLRKTFPGKTDSIKDLSKPEDYAMKVFIESHLTPMGLYYRWFDHESWKTLKPIFFGTLPKPLRVIIPELVKRKMARDLKGQGISRFSKAEIADLAAEGVEVVSNYLDNKSYFSGEEPGELDCTAFAFLANALYVPIESPLKEAAKSQSNFEGYAARMGKLAFETQFSEQSGEASIS